MFWIDHPRFRPARIGIHSIFERHTISAAMNVVVHVWAYDNMHNKAIRMNSLEVAEILLEVSDDVLFGMYSLWYRWATAIVSIDDRAEAYRKPQVSKATKEVEQECQYDIITGKAILLLF